jgi:hypothetical protein
MILHSTRYSYRTLLAILCLFGGAATAGAQNTPEMREVLSRLDRLEKDNEALTEEIRALRKELAGLHTPAPEPAVAAATPPASGQTPATGSSASPDETQAVDRARIDELNQTKVESSQKFPIRLTGMVLFNAFLNGQYNGGTYDPPAASLATGNSNGGATLAQTTLGLLYNGPQIFDGGKVSGSFYMDFFGGSTNSIGHLLRIRTASINLDWTNTSVMFGQDKPIISPRDPDSLAQVGFSPLTGAGNPWLWQPQIRIEQRFSLSNDNGFRLQAGVFETANPNPMPTSSNPYQNEQSLPGAEARLEFWQRWGESGRLEIAGGIHENRNHLGDVSLPSNVFSTDWFFRPIRRLEFSGMFFHGRNVPVLGALPPGFSMLPNGQIIPVRSNGGWAQMRIPITARLAFNVYGGEQVNRNTDLVFGNSGSNAGYFSNFMYRLAPNVIVSLEGGQVRTAYYQIGNRLNDHYDAAIAYLF